MGALDGRAAARRRAPRPSGVCSVAGRPTEAAASADQGKEKGMSDKANEARAEFEVILQLAIRARDLLSDENEVLRNVLMHIEEMAENAMARIDEEAEE
jgi:hypothetical protein